MSFKEKLTDSQGQGSAFPKLNIVQTIQLKEKDEKTKEAVFSYWDKSKGEHGENVFIPGQIRGIYIGAAMQASAYSDNLGRQGGNYTSAFYLTNKNVVLFAPVGSEYKIVCKGDMDTVEAYITKECGNNTKKKQVLLVLTKSGLIAVITNLSIAIDQINQHKEALTEKYIVLTAKTFEESATTIGKKAKEYLGKFRTKNPPKYAEISTGEMITEQSWNEWGGDKAVDEFKKWKEYTLAGRPDMSLAEAPKEKMQGNPSATNEKTSAYASNPNDLMDGEQEPPMERGFDPSENLPFRFAPIFKINF